MFSGLQKSVAKLSGRHHRVNNTIPEEHDTVGWIRIETTQFSLLCNSLLDSVNSLMVRPPTLVPRLAAYNQDEQMRFSRVTDSTTLVNAWQEYVQLLRTSEEKALKVDAKGEVTGISTQLNDCIGLASTVLNSCAERDRLWWKMHRHKELLQNEFSVIEPVPTPLKLSHHHHHSSDSSLDDGETLPDSVMKTPSLSSRVWRGVNSKAYKRLFATGEKDEAHKRERNINNQVARIKALEDNFDDATQHVELEFQRLLGNRMSVIEEILAETIHLVVSMGETEYSNLAMIKEKIPSLIESSQSRRVILGMPAKRFDWYDHPDDDDAPLPDVPRLGAFPMRSATSSFRLNSDCLDTSRDSKQMIRKSPRSFRYLTSSSSSDIPAPLESSRRQLTQSRLKFPSTSDISKKKTDGE